MPSTEGLRLIVGLLTVVPVGRIADPTPASARVAMLAAPVARAIVGLLAGAVIWLAGLVGLPPLVAGLLAVAAIALGNRGMHIDGLSDTVDGLGAGWNRERALEVMHLGNAGPMGVVAVVLVVGLQAASWAALAGGLPAWRAAVVVAALVTASGVAATVAATRGLPAAPQSGLAEQVASVVPRWLTLLCTTLAAAALVGVAVAVGLPWWTGVASSVAGLAVVAWLLWRSTRVFGGVTGDVMGAAIELHLTAASVAVLAGGLP
ncbi:adenosylcobinamide-GDP ribazoletransferase [Aestuariimicrobium soli]|uniref:adenosylcobinamide-GDP ribazoletransferase n=1 Tax=Aestuariimicrobium soli TaxID=2035834 RepID=UPI003EC0A2F9